MKKIWRIYRDGKLVANLFRKKDVTWFKNFFFKEWPERTWEVVLAEIKVRRVK